MKSFGKAADPILELLERSKQSLCQHYAKDLADRLFPEFANEFPATGLVKIRTSREVGVLPVGTPLDIIQGNKASTWRLVDEVELHAFEVTEVNAGPARSDWAPLPKGTHGILQISLQALEPSPLPQTLRCHLVGKQADSFALFQMICCSLTGAYVRDASGSAVSISCKPVVHRDSIFSPPAGLPQESRLLNDFFLCPERFTAIDLVNLPAVKGTTEVVLAFSSSVPNLSDDAIQTRCAMIINEVVRELPMIEIAATRDDWELSVLEGNQIHSLVTVKSYDLETGAWPDCKNWQFVRNSGRATLAFRTPLFDPADPPSRFVKVLARCFQPTACLDRGDELEAGGSVRARVMQPTSTAIAPACNSLLRWTASGFREPLSNESFQRMLQQQAILDGKVLNQRHVRNEQTRQEAVHKMVTGVSLLSVTDDRYISSDEEIFHGRRITIAIDPNHFPGMGYWIFVLVIARFLAAYSPFNQFTRVAIRLPSMADDRLLPPLFGRRDSA